MVVADRDGRSLAFAPDGTCAGRAAAFAEDTLIVDTQAGVRTASPWAEPGEAEVFAALVLGVRDYARKCGFSRALLGLSGGIDSALTAVIAVEALGRDNVTGVLMPSPFSSEGSLTDARDLAPEAWGLYAVASGFREIARDDVENMALQFPVYDALYAYCRSARA